LSLWLPLTAWNPKRNASRSGAVGKPRPQPNAITRSQHLRTVPSFILGCLSSGHRLLNRAKKSRFCLKTHIFSRNSGQPQDGLNPFSASGVTATPQATPF
jgi:hypothetical protein